MKTILLFTGFVVLSLKVYSQSTFGYNNRFDKAKFDSLYIVRDKGKRSDTVVEINSSLKGYIDKISEDRDSMYIRFWHIDTATDICKGDWRYVNSNNGDETFAYKIDWDTNKRSVYFSVPFKARTLTAASIPFKYRLKKNADLEAEFLNVAVTHLWIWGETRFYNHEQIIPKQWYYGWGPFAAFSQLQIDSLNTGGRISGERKVASLSYGINGVLSYENFTFVMALGFDNTIGKNASRWEENNLNDGKFHPWIGFGFGFKLIEFPSKITNSSND